jgi:hypothetical protein
MQHWKQSKNYNKGFSIQFCNIITGVNHPQEELAKFGYKLERKVENFKNPAMFWPSAAGT